jgi:putative membrane protein
MKLIKTLFAALIVLLSVLIGVLFVASNTQEVGLDLMFVQLPALGLSQWLIMALIIGFVLGFLCNITALFLLKNKNRKIQKQLKSVDSRLGKLQGTQ